MERYFIIKDAQTREVRMTLPTETEPENSVLVTSENITLQKPVFDQFPNPTCVVEGNTQEDMEAFIKEQIEILDSQYTKIINDVIWLETQKKVMREGYEIPQDIKDEYERLREEYRTKEQEILNKYHIDEK